MNINKKLIKVALITMIIALLIGGDVLFLSQGIAEAIDDNLEAQQITTSNKNVTLDSYFKDGEEKVHSKKSNISEGETLIVNIAVENNRSIKFGCPKNRK